MVHFNYIVQNLPGITVIMIDSGRNDEWFEIAKKSVADQMYPLELVDKEKNEWKPKIELIIYNNRKNDHLIGECWNKMVKDAKFNYIFILDDDDKLRPMVLFDLMFYYQVLKIGVQKIGCQALAEHRKENKAGSPIKRPCQ